MAEGVRTARELEPDRRRHLVWQLCGYRDFHLDQDLTGLVDTCTPFAGPVADRAILGTDGTYHLVAGDRATCQHGWRRGHPCQSWVRDSVAAPVFDILSVPRDVQCDRSAQIWPPPLDRTDDLGRVRQALTDAFGPGCATCDDWGRKVDHDHLTGEVRGYLCGSCNACVGLCRHPVGCRFSDYLNAPPARDLRLSYPGHASQVRSAVYRARMERYLAVVDATA